MIFKLLADVKFYVSVLKLSQESTNKSKMSYCTEDLS